MSKRLYSSRLSSRDSARQDDRGRPSHVVRARSDFGLPGRHFSKLGAWSSANSIPSMLWCMQCGETHSRNNGPLEFVVPTPSAAEAGGICCVRVHRKSSFLGAALLGMTRSQETESPRASCSPRPARRRRYKLDQVLHLKRTLRPLPRTLELPLDKSCIVILPLRFQGLVQTKKGARIPRISLQILTEDLLSSGRTIVHEQRGSQRFAHREKPVRRFVILKCVLNGHRLAQPRNGTVRILVDERDLRSQHPFGNLHNIFRLVVDGHGEDYIFRRRCFCLGDNLVFRLRI